MHHNETLEMVRCWTCGEGILTPKGTTTVHCFRCHGEATA